jgi:hypothetical protein
VVLIRHERRTLFGQKQVRLVYLDEAGIDFGAAFLCVAGGVGCSKTGDVSFGSIFSDSAARKSIAGCPTALAAFDKLAEGDERATAERRSRFSTAAIRSDHAHGARFHGDAVGPHGGSLEHRRAVSPRPCNNGAQMGHKPILTHQKQETWGRLT